MWNDTLLLNRLTRALLAIALVLVAWGGVKWLAARSEFAFRTIAITNERGEDLQRVNTTNLAELVLPRLKGTFLNMNLEDARQAFEGVPWVRRASIRRQWPNRLVVRLEEHRPLALWGTTEAPPTTDAVALKLVSEEAEVFIAPLAEKRTNYPTLFGPAGNEREVVRLYRDASAQLATLQLKPTLVVLSPRLAWSMQLSNGVTLELGRERESSTVRERLARLTATWSQTVARLARRIDTVDLRYPNGYAVHIAGFKEWSDRNPVVVPR